MKKPKKKKEIYEISENSLKMIEKSVRNFKKGKVGKPIDLSKF